MTTLEKHLAPVCVILEDCGAITVPAVWQIHFRTTRDATVTFLGGDGPTVSLVALKGERVQITARCLVGQAYYYTLELTDD